MGYLSPMSVTNSLQQVIREYLARTGESERALSERAGLNHKAVNQILHGKTETNRGSTLTKLAAAMGVEVAALLPSRAPVQLTQPELRPAPEVTIPATATLPRNLPVYGTAAGGNGDGAFVLSTGEVVDRVRRPASLAENKLAYGLYVEGDSMEPQIYAGDLLIVDPTKKARPRDKVVLVITHPDGDETRSMAYVKELVRNAPDKVIVRQFNPPKNLEFAQENVASMHRVLTTAELFGV